MLSVLIQYLIDLHVLVVNRNVVTADKVKPVKPPGKGENSLDAVLETEIWLEQPFVKIKFRQPVSFRPVREIPRHQHRIFKTIGAGIFQNVGKLLSGLRKRRFHQPVKETRHLRAAAGHTPFKRVGSIVRIAQKVGHTHTQTHGFEYHRTVVDIPLQRPGIVRPPHFFPQFAARAVLEERGIARELESEHPALQISGGGFLGCRLPQVIRKALKLSLVFNMENEGIGG